MDQKTDHSPEVWQAIQIILESATEPLSSVQIVEKARLLGVDVTPTVMAGVLLKSVRSKYRHKSIRRIPADKSRTVRDGTRWAYYNPQVIDPYHIKPPESQVAQAPVVEENPFKFNPVELDAPSAGGPIPPAEPAPAPEVQVTPRAVVITLAGVSIRIELER